MSRKGEGEGKVPGMMLGIFILILISYLAYIMLLHPWERKELLTIESNITINVLDCDSGHPINDATIYVYNEEGHIVAEEVTTNGAVTYSDFPDCFRIKASFGTDLYENVCIGSGETKVVNFCYEHPEANPNVLYYASEIGIIGGTAGEVISFQEFDNIVLSFPLSNATVNYPSYFLYSNILWTEGMTVELRNIHENITKSVNFEFTLESKRGDPEINVLANNKLLFKEKVDNGGLVRVSIPKQDLNETINIEVKCDFSGLAFWSTQDCNLTDIKATQEFYTPKKVSESFNFSTSAVEAEADTVELKFISISDASGGVKASINSVEIFNSIELLATNYSATVPARNLGLKNESNTLVIEANPSAEVWLRGVRLYFNTPVTETTEEDIEFFVTEGEFSSMNKALINFFVNNVYLNGIIKFKVNNVYYTETIDKAGWNSVIVDEQDLQSENTLRVYAPEGRFEIEELKITYE